MLPFSNDPVLLIDILKYGADCNVISPQDLVQRVELRKMSLSAVRQVQLLPVIQDETKSFS